MWVEMQIKKTGGIYRPRQGRMAFLWDSKALRGLVCLWMRMALDERRQTEDTNQKGGWEERWRPAAWENNTVPPPSLCPGSCMREADSIPFSFCLTQKPPLMYDVRRILCSILFYLYEEGHSYSCCSQLQQTAGQTIIPLSSSPGPLESEPGPQLLKLATGPLEWCPPNFRAQSDYETDSLADIWVSAKNLI